MEKKTFPKIFKCCLANKYDMSQFMNENLHEKDILNIYYLKFSSKHAPFFVNTGQCFLNYT